ncbi:MAG TPA: VWA domain-containing protein [Aquihabitans sp.]|jgi:Ca-activated chloride channel family protein|nr:VWA domain-containing protein [Aquihabitans sp.]
MTLLAPSRLWLLVLVAALGVGHLVLQRRRRQPAVRHPDLDLLVAVAPRHAGWRRHLAASTLLLAVAATVLGLARPAHAEQVPRDDAVVVLAIDTSESMRATDIAPSRMASAVDAAQGFVADAPEGYRIGLVTFDASAQVAVSPTTDRAAVTAALDDLEIHAGTAAGDAVVASLDAIEAATAGQAVTVDDVPYRAVVLLTDGESTSGLRLDQAGAQAAEAEVPVFSVAYGTPSGTIPYGDVDIPVPSDPAAMAGIAEASGGETYTATTAGDLGEVYDRIGTQVATVTEQVELTVPVAAAGAALLAAAFAMSLAWTPRLV